MPIRHKWTGCFLISKPWSLYLMVPGTVVPGQFILPYACSATRGWEWGRGLLSSCHSLWPQLLSSEKLACRAVLMVPIQVWTHGKGRLTWGAVFQSRDLATWWGATGVCLSMTDSSLWSQGRKSHVWSRAEAIFHFSTPDGFGVAEELWEKRSQSG